MTKPLEKGKQGSAYRFDSNLYRVTYISSDGPTNSDVVLANSMSDAVKTIETIGGRPMEARELARPTNVRFSYGFKPAFWEK